MTGAPTPQFLGRDLGSGWFPSPTSGVQFVNGLLRGLGFVDGEHEEAAKGKRVQVPRATPSQRPVDLDDGFISRAGCGSSPPVATSRGVAQE